MMSNGSVMRVAVMARFILRDMFHNRRRVASVGWVVIHDVWGTYETRRGWALSSNLQIHRSWGWGVCN